MSKKYDIDTDEIVYAAKKIGFGLPSTFYIGSKETLELLHLAEVLGVHDHPLIQKILARQYERDTNSLLRGVEDIGAAIFYSNVIFSAAESLKLVEKLDGKEEKKHVKIKSIGSD
jgi:hypothetical protein